MAIQTIHARLNHPEAAEPDLYCFDSEEHGLVAEPFMDAATAAIHCAIRWVHGYDHFINEDDQFAMSERVVLRFTDNEQEAASFRQEPHGVLELGYSAPEGKGYSYIWELIHPEDARIEGALESLIFSQVAWLCPNLLKYFPDGPPTQFWVQVQEG